MNPDTGLPQQCTVGDPVCPVGFICSKAARSNVGYCCSDDEDGMPVRAYANELSQCPRISIAVLDGCPSGTSPLLIAGTTTPQPCRFSGFTACPTGSRCVYSSAHLQYICCSGKIDVFVSGPRHCSFSYRMQLAPSRQVSMNAAKCSPTLGRQSHSVVTEIARQWNLLAPLGHDAPSLLLMGMTYVAWTRRRQTRLRAVSTA